MRRIARAILEPFRVTLQHAGLWDGADTLLVVACAGAVIAFALALHCYGRHP